MSEWYVWPVDMTYPACTRVCSRLMPQAHDLALTTTYAYNTSDLYNP